MTDNPRAFPSAASDDRYGGMTLRDAFALSVLPAVVTVTSAGQHFPGGFEDSRPMPERMAEDAYALADAMLAERSK